MVDESEKDPSLDKHQAIQRGRVLVVDDRRDIVRTYAVLLENAGFEVRAASNGYDALKIAREYQPDL